MQKSRGKMSVMPGKKKKEIHILEKKYIRERERNTYFKGKNKDNQS